jgi:hypothetical protein
MFCDRFIAGPKRDTESVRAIVATVSVVVVVLPFLPLAGANALGRRHQIADFVYTTTSKEGV